MKLSLVNRQSKLKIRKRDLQRLARWLLDRIELPGANRPGAEISLILTDHEGILPVNAMFFGKHRPTDVISFVYRNDEAEAVFRGEIFVNVERAIEQGVLHGGLQHELALYIAHGFDHLSGASDHIPLLRARMRRRELKWLKEASAQGLLRNLCAPNRF
ncbi:MAG: rRNA maturation RNase YbeY [Lentisphaerota bacterium]